MIVCKYYQQGKCYYGQDCRFQHINNFGGNQGNSNKPFTESKSIVLAVAEEVLAAERGGQWLLSCFGPLKEQPCIPGMDDVSPEEVRWEIYQAQKNGNVDQTKLQFQQLCQAMTAKRDALKNPTHEIAAMLDKLQKGNRDGGFGGKTNFALSTPQMSQPGGAATGANPFGAKSFAGDSTPFGGGFNGATSPTSSSIFGRSATSNTSVFGASQPSFGGTPLFGNQSKTNSLFGGGTTKTTSTVFGGNQNMQSYATVAPSTKSVFGGSTFGTTQPSGGFSMSQPVQSTTAQTGIFGGTSSTLFGAATPTTNPFGTATTVQPSNPFGGQSSTPASSTIGSASLFGAAKTTAAFGGAPVFGATGGFASTTGGASVFGGQATFDNPQIAGTNVFGGAATQSSTFGANVQTTNSFGALAVPQSATGFGGVVSTANNTPFGTPSTGPFGQSSTGNSPFAINTPFAGNEKSPFAPAANGAGGFGTSTASQQPFGTPNFANAPTTPFASTTSTTTTSNPFAPRSQQPVNTPFGVAQTNVSSTPFKQSSFGDPNNSPVVDDTAYTSPEQLTDDEKSFFMAEAFVLGKIPIKPPTIELR